MKRVIVFIIFAALLVPALTCGVSAYGGNVYDQADVLSADEESSISRKTQEIFSKYGIDIVVLIMEGSYGGKTVEQYADDFYDNGGFYRDGLLLLINVSERDLFVSTVGKCIDIYSDYGIDLALDHVADAINSGYGSNWYAGVSSFLGEVPDYYSAYQNGRPIDIYKDNSLRSKLKFLPVSFIISFIIALIYVSGMKASMNNVRPMTNANLCLKEGSFAVTASSDRFIRSATRVVAVASSSGSHSSGRGGSSTHVSSGGVTHGGGGRKF